MPRTHTQTATLLSALWLAYIFNIIFRDIHEFIRPGVLQEVLTDSLNGTLLNEGLLLIGGILVNIPIAMIVLSVALSPVASRRANLIALPLSGIMAVLTMPFPGSSADWFHAFGELCILAYAAHIAWVWQPRYSAAT
ncbi:hypothetical protein C8N43_2310 [Litoreibacter ponti]|uniref:DoxX-like protein n=1 Tax=Litoreibacter ponti TaxID=1510457 RepID=A0A2T6BNI5_9RHOB|nr:DUF6326 family protein [Litoreibacter ponti]PTX57639.1 hypothetical protein C8N43_2310 [Litoreibacter ponti]